MMKQVLTTVLTTALLLCCSVLSAQDKQISDQFLGKVELSLAPAQPLVLSGQDVVLQLTIQVHQDAEVAAVLLSGYHFQISLDGVKGPKVQQKVRGKVKLAAGTTVQRDISLPFDQVMPLPPTSMSRLSFQWPDQAGLVATVEVAPDYSDVAMETLDLAQSRVLLVTNFGNMLVKFHPDKAPKTVENFIKLSRDGFYNGSQFHRVIRDFMIQGGCPNTREGATGRPGTGDPGYKIAAEFNDMRHVKGMLSMARSADPNSAGCQFFVMLGPAPHLDNSYTGFAELVNGQDTLDRIAAVPVAPNSGGENSVPQQPVHLKMAVLQPVFK